MIKNVRPRRRLGLATKRMGVASLLMIAGVAGSAGSAVAAEPSQVGRVYAVDVNDFLYSFATDNPGQTTDVGSITGLQGGEHVIGLDFRPTDGLLYGLTDRNRIYTINIDTAAATFRSSLVDNNGNPFDFAGTDIDIDFNPTVDRLRVVTDRQENLRVNVDTGLVIVDGNLRYADGDTNAGKSPKVTGAAYTNPDNDSSTGTELFDIDPGQIAQNDIISKQDPPNAGTLNTRGNTTVNAGQLIGFDFAAGTTGYAGLITGDGNLFEKITFDNDPSTNDTPQVDRIGLIGRTGTLRDLAVALPTPAPNPVVPEFPVAALAPLLGLAAGSILLVRRRRAGQISPTSI